MTIVKVNFILEHRYDFVFISIFLTQEDVYIKDFKNKLIFLHEDI